MNRREVFERAAELERARLPFALATVVKRFAPVSSHLGDRAIVLADGRMEGFVGGSCARDIVRREALDAVRTGDARLVEVRESCASEGAVDVYVEPHLPARTLVIAGNTPVAAELARIGSLLEGYRVVRVVEAAEFHEVGDAQERTVTLDALADFIAGIAAEDRARLVAVVASQGHYDESALEVLLGGNPAYVGLLASAKRAAHVRGMLEQRGMPPERSAVLRAPAGFDIGARKPGEVAVSILAEIIQAVAAERP